MPETVLKVHEAVKRFGDTTALNNARLDLHAGEMLALLGPNGAGKTTLVRSIAGRVRLDSGIVELLGSKLDTHADARGARRQLGVVPQEVALYPTLTARENLRVFGELLGLERKLLEERSDWALEWTGLSDRADHLAGTFSGGMKRRLNIGCSILHRPQVLILDEPTVGVDPQSRHRIWEMLALLRREGASMLLTTHQLDEAQQVCERITIIDHGRTIASGSFDELARQTIGLERKVFITLEGEIPAALDRNGFQVQNGKLVHQLNDVVRDLPKLLEQVAASGATVKDLSIQAPTLQAVFLHLTGRELRD